MAKLLDATELWECRLWTLLPGLHHTALRSHRGFLRVGQGTPSRGFSTAPPLFTPLGPLGPSALLCYPVFLLTYHVFTSMNALLISSVTQILPGSPSMFGDLEFGFTMSTTLQVWNSALIFCLCPDIYTQDDICPHIQLTWTQVQNLKFL